MPPRKKTEEALPEITIKKFYAPWCQACTALESELDKVKAKHAGLGIDAINTDDDPNAGMLYGVKVLPTLVYTHNDGTSDVLEGPSDADAVLRWLKRVSA